MQSWGGPTAGDDRPTWDFPSKSGVVGVVGAALGIDRTDVSRMVALHRAFAVGVRVDQRGIRGVDFHTALAVPTAEGKTRKDPVVSRRYYLYDACFAVLLVARDGATVSLEEAQDALRRPRFAPFLGRRGCPPSAPLLVFDNVVTGESWTELFAQLPVLHFDSAPTYDAFVEGDIAEGLGRLRVRDELVGPLPRTFGERVITHTRVPAARPESDTVTPWFTR
jgi:CRISPR system Cascade subunit CasD